MIGLFQIRRRGATPGILRKQMAPIQKETWEETGTFFHTDMRDQRFTEAHAREAGYTRRKGELIPRGSKRFRRSYTGIKFRIHGHTRSLEFSGFTRRAVASARIVASSKGVNVRYPGARVFNFRNAKSRVRMGEEFRRVLPREAKRLARRHDDNLDQRLNRLSATENTTIRP